MATFTMELRRILEPPYPGVGLDDYPIFDESYRDHLNKAIIDYYKFHEIGFETVELFVDRLNQRMRLIMPTYNKLYLSTLHEYDPTLSVRMRTISDTTGNDESNTNSSSTSESTATSTVGAKSRAVNSDFPQAMLSETQDYATSAADSASESATTSSGADGGTSSTGVERASTGHFESLSEGYQSPVADLLMRYRETLVNVDLLVINELANLFFGLWNNGDEYGHHNNDRRPYPWFGVGGIY